MKKYKTICRNIAADAIGYTVGGIVLTGIILTPALLASWVCVLLGVG